MNIQSGCDYEKLLLTVLESQDVAIWELDINNHRIIYPIKTQCQSIYAPNIVENVPESLIETGFIHPDCVEDYRALFNDVFEAKKKAEKNILVRDPDLKGYSWKRITYMPVFNKEGIHTKSIGTAVSLRDTSNLFFTSDEEIDDILNDDRPMAIIVEALRNKTRELKYSLETDPLTGIKNRFYYNKIIEKIELEKIYPMNLIMFDINGLKITNDIYGHHIGDELLKIVARILSQHIGKDDILTRISGDEFVVFNPVSSEKNARDLLSAITRDVENTTINDFSISISGGTASKKSANDPIELVLQRAEDELYQNKLLVSVIHHQGLISGLIRRLKDKFPQENAHSVRVRDYMRNYAISANMSETHIKKYEDAGYLHDLGKVTQDLTFPEMDEPLSSLQYDELRKHSVIGYRILKSSGLFNDILDAVLYHHEHFDGSGFPNGLKGGEIPHISRILAICNAYDAICQREDINEEEAQKELIKYSGSFFDPLAIDEFLGSLKYGNG